MTLTVRDVAEIFNVSEKTVYRWISKGNIPVFKAMGQYRFNRAQLLEWAIAQRIKASPRLFEEPETNSLPCASLVDSLQEGGIYYRVGGHDKDSVFQSMLDLIRLPEGVERATFLEALLHREALASTGIGDGIAIPHVRGPIILHVSKPSISLCFLDKPVDFNSLDGIPVSVLFLLVSPTVRGHLQLLSRLSFALMDSNFKKAVLNQSLRDEIFEAARIMEEKIEINIKDAPLQGGYA